jgi:PhnB protein
MAVKKIPDGYSTYTPYYVVDGGAEFIDFLKKAFGAEELVRMPMPGGKLGHAEVRIGSSMIMLADQSPEHAATAVNAALYVEDCDAVFKRALEAGAKQTMPLENKFYGDRSGTVKDKWGNTWTIGTHVEDVSPEEMEKRMKAMMKPA